MTLSRRFALAVFVLLVASLAGLAGTAKAAPEDSYGAWYPDPSNLGAKAFPGATDSAYTNVTVGQFYQAGLTPLSSQDNPEISDFSCSFSGLGANGNGFGSKTGQPIPKKTVRIMRDAITTMRTDYGKALEGDISDNEALVGRNMIRLKALKDAGNYKQLAIVQLRLEASVYYRQLSSYSDPAGFSNLGIKNLFPPANSLTTPSQLLTYVPVGCDMGELDNLGSKKNIGFSTLLSHPGDFFSALLLYFPGAVAKGSFNMIEPYALAYTFWTPHSERGDLMFLASGFNCKGRTTGPGAAANCSASGQPLGYNTNNYNKAQQGKATPIWVKLAIFFTWLLSCTYFIILAGGAIIYMSRANHKSTFTIVQMMPRLLLSMILTIFLSFLIGAAITVGNTLVQFLFGMNDVGSIRGIRQVFFAIGNMYSNGDILGLGGFFAGLLEIMLVMIGAFYMVTFVLFALWRQVALIALIILSPFAMFCIIHPRLQVTFGRWLRAFAVILVAPLAMAMILKVGLSINPAVRSYNVGNTGNGQIVNASTLIGALLLLVTFNFMARIPKIAKAAIKGQPVGQGLFGKVGGLAKTAGGAIMPFNPVAGLALSAGGAAAGGLSNANAGMTRNMAKLIPDQKMRAAVTAPGNPKPSALNKMLSSDMAGDASGAVSGWGMSQFGGESPDTRMGKIKSMGAKALGAGAVAGGGMALVSGHGDERMRQRFDKHIRMTGAAAGLQETTESHYEHLMEKQVSAVGKAREKDPENFNESDFLETYWKSPGHPRMIKKGRGHYARHYMVRWKPESGEGVSGQAPHSSGPDFTPHSVTVTETGAPDESIR